MYKLNITIFFPCNNEEGNLERLVKDTKNVLNGLFADYEILIINDGSTDRTGAIADSLASKDPRIKAIHHLKNQGYGAALKSGFNNASKDLVFYTDGDGQFDIKELPKLLKIAENYDIITGYRLKRRDPFARKLYARLWGLLMNLLFNLKLRDINCAFKLYRRHIFDNIPLKSNGAFINTEIYVRAKDKGCSIFEIGVNHYSRLAGKQTGSSFKVIYKAFAELWLFIKEHKNII